MRLEAWFVPARGGGTARLRLVNTGRLARSGFELTFTSVVQLDPAPPTRLVGRRSGCHVVAPPADFVLGPGEVWEVTVTCGHRPRHANDGPASAYLTFDDGAVEAVVTGPARRVVVGPVAPATYRAAPTSDGAGAAVAAVAGRATAVCIHTARRC